MKISVFSLLLLSAVLIQSEAKHKKKKKDQLLMVDDFCVKVSGKDGKITLMRIAGADKKGKKKKKPCDDKNKITVDFDKLRELDATGQPVEGGGRKQKDNFFKNAAFSVSNPTKVTYQGLSAYKVSSTATINGASFAADVYIFNQTGMITYANETKAVTKGMMKFTIKIDNWMFCSAPPCTSVGQYLELKLKIKGKKKKAKKNKPVPVDGIFNIGDKDRVTYFNTVMIDGNSVPMPAGFPQLKTKKKKNGDDYELFLRFPKGNKISYDPTIEISQ